MTHRLTYGKQNCNKACEYILLALFCSLLIWIGITIDVFVALIFSISALGIRLRKINFVILPLYIIVALIFFYIAIIIPIGQFSIAEICIVILFTSLLIWVSLFTDMIVMLFSTLVMGLQTRNFRMILLPMRVIIILAFLCLLPLMMADTTIALRAGLVAYTMLAPANFMITIALFSILVLSLIVARCPRIHIISVFTITLLIFSGPGSIYFTSRSVVSNVNPVHPNILSTVVNINNSLTIEFLSTIDNDSSLTQGDIDKALAFRTLKAIDNFVDQTIHLTSFTFLPQTIDEIYLYGSGDCKSRSILFGSLVIAAGAEKADTWFIIIPGHVFVAGEYHGLYYYYYAVPGSALAVITDSTYLYRNLMDLTMDGKLILTAFDGNGTPVSLPSVLA